MVQPKRRRTLLKDLPLKERERKLIELSEAKALDVGQTSDVIIENYLQSLEDRDKWHVMWDENRPEVAISRRSLDYELCKIKNKPVAFKTDLLWRLPENVYRLRLESAAAASIDKEIEDKDRAKVDPDREEEDDE